MNADFEQVIGEIDSVCPKLRDPEARIVLKSWAIRLRAALSSAAEAKVVKYDRQFIADILDDFAPTATYYIYSSDEVREQARLLRAADEADAAGVGTLCRPAASAKDSPDAANWQVMEVCPIGERVLFWNQDNEEMFFGHKPEDAPDLESVVTDFPPTAAYADAWRKIDPPDSESDDGETPALRRRGRREQ